MAPDPGKGDSVYDFLYVDAQRIAVFLSQFGQYGHLTSLTRAVSETRSTSGGLNVVAAKVDTAASEQTSQTKQFDPQWLAPLSFLDQANQKGMIIRDLSDARIGQLVLASGRLAMFDLGMMRNAWEVAAIRDALIQNASAQAQGAGDQVLQGSHRDRQRQEREQKAVLAKQMGAGLEFLKLLPHAIQCSVRTGASEIWCSLREDNLIVPASELLIKHGHVIAGDWSMVGILDAFPDDVVPSFETDPERFVAHATAALSLGGLWEAIGAIAPIARAALGRPPTSFGMTPLLIFREVAV
jgi:hypothetical protein